MIWQHNHRIDRKWMIPLRLTKRRAQRVDVLRQQRQSALRQIDGEEEAAPGQEVATVMGHADIVT
jgi:hypothetical protein